MQLTDMAVSDRAALISDHASPDHVSPRMPDPGLQWFDPTALMPVLGAVDDALTPIQSNPARKSQLPKP